MFYQRSDVMFSVRVCLIHEQLIVHWLRVVIAVLLTVVFCTCVAGVCCVATARIYITARRNNVRRNNLPLALKSVKIDQKSALLNSSSDEEESTFG